MKEDRGERIVGEGLAIVNQEIIEITEIKETKGEAEALTEEVHLLSRRESQQLTITDLTLRLPKKS